VKNCIQLTLFSHVARVPERCELHSKRLERFNVQEGRTFRNLPRNKRDEDQDPAKVELVDPVLHNSLIQVD
jgi:hypothetical protein